jgi:hypothetical protein
MAVSARLAERPFLTPYLNPVTPLVLLESLAIRIDSPMCDPHSWLLVRACAGHGRSVGFQGLLSRVGPGPGGSFLAFALLCESCARKSGQGVTPSAAFVDSSGGAEDPYTRLYPGLANGTYLNGDTLFCANTLFMS